jgi:hypothetical protein
VAHTLRSLRCMRTIVFPARCGRGRVSYCLECLPPLGLSYGGHVQLLTWYVKRKMSVGQKGRFRVSGAGKAGNRGRVTGDRGESASQETGVRSQEAVRSGVGNRKQGVGGTRSNGGSRKLEVGSRAKKQKGGHKARPYVCCRLSTVDCRLGADLKVGATN